ncbi:hypothetical protein BDR26DRAFT_857369 [Obelidium mucronatum]|nr:hypothetical protein BDR26DRAFT_857369 [Obelidium mucronatum]
MQKLLFSTVFRRGVATAAAAKSIAAPIRLAKGDALHAHAALAAFFAGHSPVSQLAATSTPTSTASSIANLLSSSILPPSPNSLVASESYTSIAYPDSTTTLTYSASSAAGKLEQYHAISIKKIRRKKMNKHKWKKNRRAVRDSTRYNKERRKKKGPMREKQE